MRVGIGYDIHRLVTGRKLILGGIEIPFEKGLDGHSDADVLIHAICDALLGAAGMGDIGMHFPDVDPAFRDIYSIRLLERSWKMVSEKYPRIYNIDATIFAEAPQLGRFREAMVETISRTMGIPPASVNIKATTTEGLGLVGSGDGMAAMCIVMVGDF
ncbi:MAG: 2-C-methyl-D-erythritol 2,4-cyclodiphosphate synthase [Desulfosalsimonadaceae bacterium]